MGWCNLTGVPGGAQAFLAFDDNDDGYISRSEFRRGVDALQVCHGLQLQSI